jgi:hypothetical protein
MATNTKHKTTDPAPAIESAPASRLSTPALVPEPEKIIPLAERAPASPLDLPAEVFRAALDRRKANRGALMDWVRSALVEGADFGRIHTAGKQKCQLAFQGRAHECQEPSHWSKPSLWKPGAEKICGMLGVTVHYPNLPAYEDAAIAGKTQATIILRCELRDGQGRVVAEGIGARSLQQDYGDLNKALKMAGKSAHIDATLRMAGLSEVFTQDLEDLRPTEAATPKSEAPPDPAEPAPRQTISAADHRRLEATIRDFGLDRERVKEWVRRACKVEHFPDLSQSQFERLLKKLRQWHDEEAERLAYEKAQADDAKTDDCPF